MSFYGDYGDLSTLEAAKSNLRDLEAEFNFKTLNDAYDFKTPESKRYDIGRILKQIEGLQMIILRNGGNLNHSLLPLLYRPVDLSELHKKGKRREN